MDAGGASRDAGQSTAWCWGLMTGIIKTRWPLCWWSPLIWNPCEYSAHLGVTSNLGQLHPSAFRWLVSGRVMFVLHIHIKRESPQLPLALNPPSQQPVPARQDSPKLTWVNHRDELHSSVSMRHIWYVEQVTFTEVIYWSCCTWCEKPMSAEV